MWEFVQAYKEHRIKNDNKPRTVDAIYLEPNMNAAGGHWVMNITTGACMHKPRVWEAPITESVIRAIESLAESQGHKMLKLTGKNKTRLLPSDWDEEEEYVYDDDYENDENSENDEDEQLDTFDEINEEEMGNIRNDAEEAQENENDNDEEAEDEDIVNNAEPIVNQNVNENENNDNNAQPEEVETDEESNEERQTRTRNRPETFTYERMGQTHQQTKNEKKDPKFSDELFEQIEQCHNLMTSEGSDTVEYNPDLAQIIGQIMVDINSSVTRRGLDIVETFAQQYMLERGLKKFGNEGEKATYKEMEQLHKRRCFTPISVKELTKEEKKKAQRALCFLTQKND